MTVANETAIQVVERIELETGEWLKEHGYHPTVAHLHIEAIHLQNKVLSTKVLEEILMLKPRETVSVSHKHEIVQLYNPRSHRYIKVDKTVGGIIGHGKRDGTPYKNIPVVSKSVKGE